ncbi:hypothetical protein [Halorientalis sp. IM1011]|uniref:hypothetical protein n=1 Tax=Halorientalis sp. IM1011 TaxID=1932360 RepID=UPI0012F8EF40|nr:hypothetical protein [Halorientalis sp. IM1011]
MHTDSLEKHGSLCSSCESKLQRLGVTDDADDPEHGDQCVQCRRTGVFALPEMQLSVDEETDGDEILYEYEIVEGTPRLCTDHLESLLQEPRQVDPLNMLDDRI